MPKFHVLQSIHVKSAGTHAICRTKRHTWRLAGPRPAPTEGTGTTDRRAGCRQACAWTCAMQAGGHRTCAEPIKETCGGGWSRQSGSARAAGLEQTAGHVPCIASSMFVSRCASPVVPARPAKSVLPATLCGGGEDAEQEPVLDEGNLSQVDRESRAPSGTRWLSAASRA